MSRLIAGFADGSTNISSGALALGVFRAGADRPLSGVYPPMKLLASNSEPNGGLHSV